MSGGREFDLIERYFKPLTKGNAEALNLADDAAVLDIPHNKHLVVTTDTVVADVHFLSSLDPEDIAHKVVGVNLSDLAAMGAAPRAVFLAAQFPPDTDEKWIASFAEGMAHALAPSGAILLGGDTVATPGPLAFTLTALGMVKKGQALLRQGANVGDYIFVSGTIGDGALGLLCHTEDGFMRDDQNDTTYLKNRYARPQPRFLLGQALAEQRGSKQALATACVDISDGLVADINHMTTASKVGAVIESKYVPLSNAAKNAVGQNADLMRVILCGGDDYELAFCVKPEAAPHLVALSKTLCLPLTKIGKITPLNAGVEVLSPDGDIMKLGKSGYQHF